jgi:hypothetical protein
VDESLRMRWAGRREPAGRLLSLVVVLLLAAGGAFAEEDAPATLGVGDALAALTLEDQHGETRAVDESVRLILFSRDMDGGGVIRAVLDPETLGQPPAAFLEGLGALCVADVHRMPGLVRRVIAKPRMRKRPYPLLLDEKGEATAAWPSAEGRATLIRLDGLRVTAIRHFEAPAALREALAPPPGR